MNDNTICYPAPRLPDIERYGGDTTPIIIEVVDPQGAPYHSEDLENATFNLTAVPYGVSAATGNNYSSITPALDIEGELETGDNGEAIIVFAMSEEQTLSMRGKYIYQVDIFNGEETRPLQGRLDVRQNIASSLLVIVTQPVNVVAEEDDDAPFSVVANGRRLTYRWQYRVAASNSESDWTNSGIEGADTASFEVPALAARNGWQYRCLVTNASGATLASDVARLIVSGYITITKQPENATVIAGDTITFSTVAFGDGLTYQWQYSDAATPGSGDWSNTQVEGSDSSTLRVTAIQGWNGRKYRCVITDSSSQSTTATTNTAVLTVTSA